MSYTNADGLYVLTNTDQGAVVEKGTALQNPEHFVKYRLDATDLIAAGGTDRDPYIPAGAHITRAVLVVTTAFAGGTSLTIGLAQKGGSVIDADGIDAAVAAADLAANKVVQCDGALVGAVATVGANNAYVYTTASGTFTAGAATLYIWYVDPA